MGKGGQTIVNNNNCTTTGLCGTSSSSIGNTTIATNTNSNDSAESDCSATMTTTTTMNATTTTTTTGSSTATSSKQQQNSSTATTTAGTTTPTTTVPGKTDFYWSTEDEPHAERRKIILAKYPEIKQLYGIDPYLRYQVVFVVLLQISLSLYVRYLPWYQFVIIAYVIGGTCNHMMLMAIHELAHNLGFKYQPYNRYFAIFVANLPIAIPGAVTFKRYHMEHHRYQGVDSVDVDVPTILEGNVFSNTIAKFWFVVFQILFYVIRPMFVNPKDPELPEIINIVAVLSFDASLTYLSGSFYPLLYLLLSTVLGMGMHPCAGHFIAEHYVFPDGKTKTADDKDVVSETYSYYGPCNMFNFNVGYHNEHHDFPFVPGRRLPLVYEIATEFYEPLPHHTSYIKVMYDYITNDTVSGYSRVKRATTSALRQDSSTTTSTTGSNDTSSNSNNKKEQ